MESYPPTPVTNYGATLLNEGIEPQITYITPDGKRAFYLNGGLAPWPGVTEGITLAEGMSGLHPQFRHLDHKGARSPGVTNAGTVYDPAEIGMNVVASSQTPSNLRSVIRKWIEAWDPTKRGTLSWVTPESGEWWCLPRLMRPPPEKLDRTYTRNKEQRFSWSIRNDDAFWRSYDSTSTYRVPFNAAEDLFVRDDAGTLGANWSQTYSGAGAGVCETDGTRAVWTPSGIAQREVVNRWLGINEIQTITVNGAPTTWTLKLGTQTTTAITHPASAATVQTKLEALSNIGAGNVTVAGSAGGPYTATFINTLAKQNIDTMVGTVTAGGTNPYVQVATTTQGAPAVTPGDNQVIRFTLGAFYGWPWPTNARLDIWGRLNTAGTTGVRLRISGTDLTVSRFNAGVETVMYTKTLDLTPIWNEDWALVCGDPNNTRRFKVLRAGFPVIDFIETGTGSVIGSSNRGGGWGMRAGAGSTAQDVPPTIEQWSGDANVPATSSGFLHFNNPGDQEAFPELVVYGPGTFSFGNGPGGPPAITFGPLTDNQAALLQTHPGHRGVHDISTALPEQDLPFFQSFIKGLVTFAFNNDVPPLFSWFESFFGITPPQGTLYSLLKGRWTKGVPAHTQNPPETNQITVKIENGTADSKVIAALTPTKRWPE